MTSITRETRQSNVSGDSLEFQVFTLKNNSGLEVQVMNYGATIISIKYTDGKGVTTDVVLGYDKLEGRTKANLTLLVETVLF